MKLALFFTYAVSLEQWEKMGILSREIKIYQMLAEKIDQVYFFTYGSKNDLPFESRVGEKITILPNKWKIPHFLYGFLMPFFYRQHLKNIDIFRTHQMAGAVPAVIAKLLFKKKLIVRCGYEWLNFLEKQKKPLWKKTLVFVWEKIAYQAADIVIFTSQKDKLFAQEKFHIPERKIRLIGNYIDTEIFQPLNVPKIKNSIIYVGRLSKEKNLFSLLEAMEGLGLRLTMVGQGPLQKPLEIFAREKKVWAEFKGLIPNEHLPQKLNQYEIFILPSLYEGCPKALLEAMACGLACVACDVPGAQEVITHLENGYLCDTDSFSLRQALQVVSQNKELREKMGKNARETILRYFSLGNIMQKEYDILEDVNKNIASCS